MARPRAGNRWGHQSLRGAGGHRCVSAPRRSRSDHRQLAEVGSKSLPLIQAAGFALGAVLTLHTRETLVDVWRHRVDSDSAGPGVLRRDRSTCPRPAGGWPRWFRYRGCAVQHEGDRTNRCDRITVRRLVQVSGRAPHRRVHARAPSPDALPGFFCLLGGFASEYAASRLSFQLYISRAFSAFEWSNFDAPTLKTAVFGFAIGTISSFLGYTTDEGANGVGRAATGGVVVSSLAIIFLDVLLIKFIFFIFPETAL